ncbi:MAG: YfcC family protein, partial [Acidimicrobiia bacterium]
MTDSTSAAEVGSEPVVESDSGPEKPNRAFPSPLTILTGVMVLVWIAAFFIPSGQYELNEQGQPVPGSYHEIESPLDTPSENIENLVLAPVNGLYGIQDPDTGQVGPFNSGSMFGLAQVFLFILAIGGFMTVVFATGALDLGIAHLAHRFRSSGVVLIIALSILFGVLGSVMSWSDETLGFYALIVPLMLALGYDRIVAVAVVTVAPFVGIIGSTINPFRIGVGSEAAGISIADGIGLRILLLVLAMAAMIFYTVRYAARVKADPSNSVIGIGAADAAIAAEGASDDLEPLTGRHKLIIGLVGFTFALLTFSIIPWAAIFENELVDPVTHESITKPFWFELGWWLPELSVLFVIMAIVIGVVGRLGEARFTRTFIQGVTDFTGPAILVTVARGISCRQPGGLADGDRGLGGAPHVVG